MIQTCTTPSGQLPGQVLAAGVWHALTTDCSLNATVRCNRQRVRREVFKGQDAKGVHRTGSEGAALAILGYATIACAAYLFDTGLFTGTLLGKQHPRASCSNPYNIIQICDNVISCHDHSFSRILCVIMHVTWHVACLLLQLH